MPNYKYFLVTESKRKHVRIREISTTSRRELSSSFFFLARQGAVGISRHSDKH